MANEKEVKAQVKLRFIAANGQRILAVRNLSVTLKKTSGMTMKTLESILALDGNKTAGKVNVHTSFRSFPVLSFIHYSLREVLYCANTETYLQ